MVACLKICAAHAEIQDEAVWDGTAVQRIYKEE